jgi:stage II sporulation protein D
MTGSYVIRATCYGTAPGPGVLEAAAPKTDRPIRMTVHAPARARWFLPFVAGIVLLVNGALPSARLAPGRSTIALPKTVRVQAAGRVRTVPLEDYTLVAALAEISPVDETPAVVARLFEVQTVIARTYGVANLRKHGAQGFDVCDTTHCQLYQPGRLETSRFVTAARAAAANTRGRVLTFGPRVAQALFHADCGGHTIAANAVWRGAPVSYLVGAPDQAGDVHRNWTFDAPRDLLRLALNANEQTAVGARLTAITVAVRDPSGRASRVTVQGGRRLTLTGERFRSVVNAAFGPKALQSTLFDVTTTAGGFQFRGAGYGHGVGLCQVGAAARARRGDSLTEILQAYFPGAELN